MVAEPRLTADLWVSAYMARLRLANIPHFLRFRGDHTAGAVLVSVNHLNGSCVLFQRSIGLDGGRVWAVLAEGSEREVEEAMARQRGFDPDLWVIELEDREGRHLLDEPGLAE